MEIESVTDLIWADAEHTMFSCNAKYDAFNEVHPAGINGTDPYPHIRFIWDKGVAGAYGEIAEYIPPPPPLAQVGGDSNPGIPTIPVDYINL